MPSHVLAWDIETVPDLRAYAAANGHVGKSDDEVREAMDDKFPKLPYHSMICIGALVTRRDNAHWDVIRLGAPHVGERSEKELIVEGSRAQARCTAPECTRCWWRRLRFSSVDFLGITQLCKGNK